MEDVLSREALGFVQIWKLTAEGEGKQTEVSKASLQQVAILKGYPSSKVALMRVERRERAKVT